MVTYQNHLGCIKRKKTNDGVNHDASGKDYEDNDNNDLLLREELYP